MRYIELGLCSLRMRVNMYLLWTQYECSEEGGVTVFVRGVPFKCSCEGEEVVFIMTDTTFCHQL